MWTFCYYYFDITRYEFDLKDEFDSKIIYWDINIKKVI